MIINCGYMKRTEYIYIKIKKKKKKKKKLAYPLRLRWEGYEKHNLI